MSNTFLIILLVCLLLLPIGLYFLQKKNLNYYKINGRTPLEIECWLKTRPWFGLFVDNIKNEIIESHRDDKGEVLLNKELMNEIKIKTDYIIEGNDDKYTISNAFCWMTSLEGTRFWGNIEYKFLMWYFGQYVDFHLVK